MIELIGVSLGIALAVLFIHATMWEGMIFGIVREKLWDLTPKLQKPIYDCPICMTPWYGALILFWLRHNFDFNFNTYALILLIAGGFNTLFVLIQSND